MHRFGGDPEPGIREQVAKALVYKGVTLRKAGDDAGAVRVYDEAVHRFGGDPEPGIREQVAKALVNKGVTLRRAGDVAGAVQTYDELVQRFGRDPQPAISEQVATALVNKGVARRGLGPEESRLAVDSVERARDGYLRLGQARGVADCDKLGGDLGGLIGNLDSAEKAYTSARGAYELLDEPDLVADCDLGLARVAAARLRYGQAEGLFLRARSTFKGLGLWRRTAGVDIDRADLLERQRRAPRTEPVAQFQLAARELGLLLPALLAVDSVRYDLPGQSARSRWVQDQVVTHLGQCLAVAKTSANQTLIAELIETARAFGRVALPDNTDNTDDPAEPTAEPGNWSVPAAVPMLVVGWDTVVLPLAPTAGLVMPGGRVALDRHHQRAQRAYGRATRASGAGHRLIRFGAQPDPDPGQRHTRQPPGRRRRSDERERPATVLPPRRWWQRGRG